MCMHTKKVVCISLSTSWYSKNVPEKSASTVRASYIVHVQIIIYAQHKIAGVMFKVLYVILHICFPHISCYIINCVAQKK